MLNIIDALVLGDEVMKQAVMPEWKTKNQNSLWRVQNKNKNDHWQHKVRNIKSKYRPKQYNNLKNYYIIHKFVTFFSFEQNNQWCQLVKTQNVKTQCKLILVYFKIKKANVNQFWNVFQRIISGLLYNQTLTNQDNNHNGKKIFSDFLCEQYISNVI